MLLPLKLQILSFEISLKNVKKVNSGFVIIIRFRPDRDSVTSSSRSQRAFVIVG